MPWLCPECGYDLSGVSNVAGVVVCPECGRVIDVFEAVQPGAWKRVWHGAAAALAPWVVIAAAAFLLMPRPIGKWSGLVVVATVTGAAAVSLVVCASFRHQAPSVARGLVCLNVVVIYAVFLWLAIGWMF